tara:strand:- start:1191 stop:1853 length:663 start_codon:yes stop_codon:yes gene_type:complete
MDSDNMSEWTTIEREYLGELLHLESLKIEEITYLVNDKFNMSRTVAFVKERVDEMKKVKFTTNPMITAPNSRKSWVTADDKYLLENWTANTNTQREIATNLGRTIASCSTRVSVLKHKPQLREYYLTLIAGGLTTGQVAIIDEPIVVEQDVKVITTNVSHLLVGVRPAEYTSLDRLYHWLKTRAVKKQMKNREKETTMREVNELKEQISQLNKEIKLKTR